MFQRTEEADDGPDPAVDVQRDEIHAFESTAASRVAQFPAIAGELAVPSRATVTRGVNSAQSLFLSLAGMRIGIGLRH